MPISLKVEGLLIGIRCDSVLVERLIWSIWRIYIMFHECLRQSSYYLVEPLLRVGGRDLGIGLRVIIEEQSVYVRLASSIRVMLLTLHVSYELIVNDRVEVVA
jgi:hypothetical protein